jgi:hypothetical protein
MKLLSHRNGWLLGAGLGCCAIGAGIMACSSSSSGGSGSGANSGSGSGGACSGSLTITYDPMYSAFVSGYMFQVPVIVTGVSAASVTWTVSDTKNVQLQANDSFGGEMLTITGPPSGPVTVTAKSTDGTLCNTAPLNVTTNITAAQFTAGKNRYNNSVGLTLPMFTAGQPPMFNPNGPSIFEPADGGPGPACTNCHGPTATTGMFRGVEHTPEQTAGFSDSQLIDIITKGIIPDGGTYDPTILPYMYWQFFHRWADLSSDEQIGMVGYLRSLTPESQGGKFDFGGIMPPPGMGPPSDDAGGTPTGDDASTETDAAASGDSTTPVVDATTTPDGGSDAAPE